MQVEDASLDEMWRTIEKFGIERRLIEDKMNNQEVKELYLLILNSNKRK